MKNKKIELELKRRMEKLNEEVESQYQLTKSIIEDYGSELAGDIWDKYKNMEREYELLNKYFETSDKEIKINLEKLTIKNGNMSEMKVNANKNNYSVKFNSESIIILGEYPYIGGNYNRKAEELTWKLRHTCKSPTGMDSNPDKDSILRNPCIACKLNGETNDKEIGIIYGNKYLTEIISYSEKIEEEVKKLKFIVSIEDEIDKPSRECTIPYDSIDDGLMNLNSKRKVNR